MSKEIKTDLSLLKNFEDIVSDVQKEIMKEEIEELSPIKENDINISTTYVFDDGEDLEAKVYFRNGLSKEVNFENVPLILLNSKGEPISVQVFDLRELGNIPSCAARPWKVYFKKSLVNMKKYTPGQCRVIFYSNLKAVHYADIEFQDFPQNFVEFKADFEKFLYELPKMEKDQISISTFNISLNTEGKILITLVIRNSKSSDIKIEELPITIKDEQENIVTSGIFHMNNSIVKSMKAKIFSLAFETSLSTDKTTDFSKKWHLALE